MDFLKKYKLRIINYNLISKINPINIRLIPGNVTSIDLLIKNNWINSPYELITILFLLQLICKQKPIILKSKKDNVLSGIRKNDSISGKISLKNNVLTAFYLKIVNNYFNVVDFSRNIHYIQKTKQNIFNLNFNNINKIDVDLIKETGLLKNYTLEVILKQKKIITNIKYINNINLVLSHLKFPFNK